MREIASKVLRSRLYPPTAASEVTSRRWRLSDYGIRFVLHARLFEPKQVRWMGAPMLRVQPPVNELLQSSLEEKELSS
jgi:hypothetical protein